jgi:hypothetical protein
MRLMFKLISRRVDCLGPSEMVSSRIRSKCGSSAEAVQLDKVLKCAHAASSSGDSLFFLETKGLFGRDSDQRQQKRSNNDYYAAKDAYIVLLNNCCLC